MVQTQANNLKPGDILLNIGIVATVSLTKNHVEISIVGAPQTVEAQKYFKPDELVYLHESLTITEEDETFLIT